MPTTLAIAPGTYAVDPSHSNVGFEVKHMGIATIRGTFRTFEGTITATDSGAELSGSVQVSSVDTGEPNRDGHLQSPDFFDAAQHPTITFRALSIEGEGEHISLTGDITIRGVTQPITLTGTALEGGEDPWGNVRVGFDVEGEVDRTEFGLSFNQTLASGNLLVGNHVKLIVSVSAVKAA